MKNKKFLIFDVDDTVTKHIKEISEEMANSLNNLQYEIAFISGTSISELKRMVSANLSRKHHLLGSSGTHYVLIEGENEKELIKEKLLETEKTEIINSLKKLKEKYNLIPLTSEEDQIHDRDSQITLSILGRNASSEKKYNYDPSKEKRKEFITFLKSLLREKYDLKIGGTTSIDITKKGFDKSQGINRFIELNE